MKNLACFFILFLSSSLAEDRNARILVDSNRLFTPLFYKEIEKQSPTGNLMCAPTSTELALLLLEFGAKGQTYQEILQALQLHFVSNEIIANGTKSLLTSVISSKDYKLNIANGLFVQENYTIKNDFKKEAIETFDSKIQNVDFAKSKETAKSINSWVENQTNNKIQDLIDPSNLNGLTRLVLANALYFEGNWTIPFPPKSTKKCAFYKTPTDTIQVNMMELEGKTFEYAHCPCLKAEFLKLPINGNNASMIIVLPTKKDGLADLEKFPKKIFTPRNLTNQAVNVRFPKFSIKSSFKLTSVLQNLGVEKAFAAGQADFSGIAGQKGELFLSDVNQKTFIQVSEKGVEAAAATAAGISTTSIVLTPPDAINFNCDHPFFFYIVIEDLIKFAGRVVNPNQTD